MLLLGIKDFLPTQTSEAYDNFTQVTERASQWISTQTDKTITNLQGIFVKRKGRYIQLKG